MEFKTKQDYINALTAIIEPIRGELKRGGARPSFGSAAAWYNDASTAVETFARPLWGLVPLWRGGYGDEEMKQIYRDGIIEGTNPKSEKYWGETGQCDQRYVEMASMAYAMLFTPEVIWEPLTQEEKDNFKTWLRQINTHSVCDSNWRFFRVLVNLAFKQLGEDYSAELLEEDLSRFDDFYLGNGWYMDGPQHQKDYYISMAIHFYGLIYACFANDEYAEKFRRRAELFGREFIYWFADNGEALPYGRSLTYRFAQGAFWSACILAGVKPFDTAVMKGIISRHLLAWMNKPIFDNGGVLTVGYAYQNLIMGEHYNSPGSPYWGLKFFAMLALTDDDEFWQAECAPLPTMDTVKLQREADMLIHREDGEVFAYTPGTHDNLGCGQIISKYLKFAYSTKFGFNVSCSNLSVGEASPDNMLVFDIDGVICQRRMNYSFELTESGIVINWSPAKGIRVKTEVIPEGGSHIRKHTITSDRACIVYDCGYAVADRDCDHRYSGSSEDRAWAGNDFQYCAISAEGCLGRLIGAAVNTNVLYPKTVIPAVMRRIDKGTTTIVTKVTTHE